MVDVTCHHGAAPEWGPRAEMGRKLAQPPGAKGPHLVQAVCTRCSSGCPGKVPAVPGAAWERVVLLVCHSCQGQRGSGTGIITHGHLTNTAALHRGSLGLLKPHGKAQPCKVGHKQHEGGWCQQQGASQRSDGRVVHRFPPRTPLPRASGGRAEGKAPWEAQLTPDWKGDALGCPAPWLRASKERAAVPIFQCVFGPEVSWQSYESHMCVKVGLWEVLRSVFCFSAVPQIQFLFCWSVPQEGLTVTSSLLDFGGLE